jgi:hypothetical protein
MSDNARIIDADHGARSRALKPIYKPSNNHPQKSPLRLPADRQGWCRTVSAASEFETKSECDFLYRSD